MDALVEYTILFIVATFPMVLCVLAFWLMLKRAPGWGWLVFVALMWMAATPKIRVHVDTSKPTCTTLGA